MISDFKRTQEINALCKKRDDITKKINSLETEQCDIQKKIIETKRELERIAYEGAGIENCQWFAKLDSYGAFNLIFILGIGENSVNTIIYNKGYEDDYVSSRPSIYTKAYFLAYIYAHNYKRISTDNALHLISLSKATGRITLAGLEPIDIELLDAINK